VVNLAFLLVTRCHMCRADASMCVIRCESAVDDEEVMMMVMLRMILV
jgi:hypothetical protein